ncbi:PiggyBac transposable element-derived protein 4, partial [Gonioctena quinquepunctata]
SEWSGAEEQAGDFAEDFEPVESDSDNPEVQIQTPADITWVENPAVMRNMPFSGQQGLKVNIPGEGRPIDFFTLLADDEFFDLLVNETNAYAALVLLNDPNPRPQSRISRWKPVDRQEMTVFFGLLFHMGIIQLPRLRDYWRKHRLYNLPFGSFRSRNRFLLIMRCLHFSPNPQEGEPRSSDRLSKVRTLQKKLSIDDSMLLWQGRLMFRQYIKNKKDKYGIKFYLLTESNGTIMKIQIYTGAADDMGGKGHATKIVLNLANNYLDQGYSLYMDNFYNSVDLARQLLERNTYCTGTLRNGRKGSPSQVKTAKLKSGESVQSYSRQICVVKWKDKREVLYISTEHENVLQEVTSRSGRMGEKPLPIAEYNEYMSGIDLQDQMMAYYPSHRKTIRWYKKVGIHIIEMMLYNSFMIYNKHSVQKMSYLDFRQSIIDVFLPESAENVPVIREAHHYPSKSRDKMSDPVRPQARSSTSYAEKQSV